MSFSFFRRGFPLDRIATIMLPSGCGVWVFSRRGYFKWRETLRGGVGIIFLDMFLRLFCGLSVWMGFRY